MPKYLVKLTKFKGRCSITIPTELVRTKGLLRYKYILISDYAAKPITIRGYVDEKDLE